MDQIINADIRTEIERILRDSPQNVELEARYRDFHMNKGLDIRTYQRLIKTFDIYNSTEIISEDRILTNEDLRYTIMNIPGQSPQISLIKKKAVEGYPKNLNSYPIRIGLSTEEKIKVSETLISRINNAPKNDIIRRIKNRKSFRMSEHLRIDMTKVIEINKGISITKYELELELLNPVGLGVWYEKVLEILRLVQNTDIVYTLEEYTKLIRDTNRYLGFPNETSLAIENSALMDARNLKFGDLVYGGLVGNQKVGYRVTVKSDGERKLMIVSPSGVYLVWNSEVNKIYSGDDFTARYSGYIFDGELITKEALKPSTEVTSSEVAQSILPPIRSNNPVNMTKYWYLIFDLINYNDGVRVDSSVRTKPHTQRMLAAQKFKDNLVASHEDAFITLSKTILIETKIFYAIKSVDAFYANMKAVNDLRLAVVYNEDGFIFVPDEAPYARVNMPQHLRILTDIPDITKWKPHEKITIDVAVAKTIGRDPQGGVIESLKIQGSSRGVSKDRDKVTFLSKYTGTGYTTDRMLRHFPPQKLFTFISNNLNYHYPGQFNPSRITSNINLLFEWNPSSNSYIGSKTLDQNMTPLIMLENKLKNKESFVIEIYWNNIDNVNRIMELRNIQKFNFEHPERNYVDIDKPFDKSHKMLQGLPSGFIVEFAWDGTQFVPIKLRANKRIPNNVDTIQDNWNMIQDPIELDTLLGNNIRLMRKEHNRIKRKLFSESPGKFLLDLGSGEGGDVQKTVDYDKIIFVEPDAQHIVELVNRIKSVYEIPTVKIYRPGDVITNIENEKVIVLESKAENHEFITNAVNVFFGRPADVISIMLALSFFWKDTETLQSLIRTISNNLKVGGVFIYMTIDGTKVKQKFDPTVKGPIVSGLSLLNGDITMRYLPMTKELKVRYKGTIVGNNEEEQTEYLVMLDDLRSYFGPLGIEEIQYEFANKQAFLNKDEFILTGLYSYGKFIRKFTNDVISNWRPTYLYRGNKVNSYNTPIDSLTGKIAYKYDITACKWYKGTLYRSSQPTLKNKKLSLLISILRVITSEGFDGIFNGVMTNLNKHITNNKININDDIDMEVFLIKLAEIYKVDISLVEINDINLLPVVTKMGHYDECIIIGRTEDGYENIGELIPTGIKFRFGSKSNMDHVILSLAGITLLNRLPEDKMKEYGPRFNTIYNGEKDYQLIKDMQQLIPK